MADIEIGVGKENITDDKSVVEFTTYGEVVECDNTSIEIGGFSNVIEANTECIDIEITGLKTIQKFIGLEDTPLYYENGQFFKVENNRIVYAYLRWEDISGNIDDNPQLKEYLLDIVQKADEGYVQDTIVAHNNDIEAHPYIQNSIQEKHDTLNNKIELNKIDFDSKINILDNKVEQNKSDISTLDKYSKDVNSKLEELILEVDVDIKGSISSINDDLQTINQELNENFTILDTKIDTSKNELKDNITETNNNLNTQVSNLNTKIDYNFNNLDTRVSANTNDIADLTKVVEDDFQEVNINITDLDAKISNNTSVINNNTQLINQTIENLKQYSKTEDFANVAFTGEYKDLLNIPQNIATTEYVDSEIDIVVKSIVNFDFIIVDSLPEIGESNHIYLKLSSISDTGNTYEEYIWITGESRYELIGLTKVDLSDYYTKTETDDLLTEIKELKQDKLIASDGIDITNNTISATVITIRNWSE